MKKKFAIIAIAALVTSTSVMPAMASEGISDNHVSANTEQQSTNDDSGKYYVGDDEFDNYKCDPYHPYKREVMSEELFSRWTKEDVREYISNKKNTYNNLWNNTRLTEKDGKKGVYYAGDISSSFFPLPNDYYFDEEKLIPQYVFMDDEENNSVVFAKVPEDYYGVYNGYLEESYMKPGSICENYNITLKNGKVEFTPRFWTIPGFRLGYGLEYGFEHDMDTRALTLLSALSDKVDGELGSRKSNWYHHLYKKAFSVWVESEEETGEQCADRLEKEIRAKYKEISDWEQTKDDKYDYVCKIEHSIQWTCAKAKDWNESQFMENIIHLEVRFYKVDKQTEESIFVGCLPDCIVFNVKGIPYYEYIVEDVREITDKMQDGTKSVWETKEDLYHYLCYGYDGFSVAIKDKDTFRITVVKRGYIIKITEDGIKTEKAELKPKSLSVIIPESLKPENQTVDGIPYAPESGNTGYDDRDKREEPKDNGDDNGTGGQEKPSDPKKTEPEKVNVTTAQVGSVAVTYTDHITFHGKKASFDEGTLNIKDANGNKVSVKKISIKKATKTGSTTFKIKVNTSDKALKKAFAKKTFNVVIDPYEVTASDKVEISVNGKGKIKKVVINGVKLKKNEYSGTADSMTFSGRFTGKYAK
ncbi:hypothetical protein SAMN06296386_11726 [Lachnospiraceae bacterium]|nr:hypothetical protein SAMN06296386_11726 [Lachnospiraceae bacterium]